MANYPELPFTDSSSGAPRIAKPTGRYKVESIEPRSVADFESRLNAAIPGVPIVTATLLKGLFATIDLSGTSNPNDVAQIQNILADPRAAWISRILPIYEVTTTSRALYPQPESIFIHAANPLDAENIRRDLVTALNASPVTGEETYTLNVEYAAEFFPKEFIPGGGIYELAIRDGNGNAPREPQAALHLLELGRKRGHTVCGHAEHPVELISEDDPACGIYQENFEDRYAPAPEKRESQIVNNRVAVLDSFFDFEHPSLEFIGPDGAGTGIATIELDTCAINDHGTACAGVIASRGPDEFAGEDPGVEVLPIRFFEYGLLALGEKSMALAIRAAVDFGAAVISISYAMSDEVACVLEPALNYAEENGVVVVAGAGNARAKEARYPIDLPAGLPTVVGVAAATYTEDPRKDLELVRDARGLSSDDPAPTWSSKYGPRTSNALGVSVVAQGLEVHTTRLSRDKSGNQQDPYLDNFLGTSAAAPIVAGLAIRLRQMGLDAPGIRERIECMAEQFPDFDSAVGRKTGGRLKRYSSQFGFGLIRRRRANLDCVDDGTVSKEEPQMEHGENLEVETPREPEIESAEGSDDCLTCPEFLILDEPNLVDCLRPLSTFLEALGNEDCCHLLYAFLRDPYLTARSAGLPYSASVWLGSGDWESVNQALAAENYEQTQEIGQIIRGLGPIWVKAT